MKCRKWMVACLMMLGFSASAMAADNVNIGPWSYQYKELTMKPVGQDGTLIFSDCPEYVEKPGRLYEGTVKSGEGRVYYYHVNDTGEAQRVVVYAKSNKNQNLTIEREIKSKASSDYLYVGDNLSWHEVVDPKTSNKTIKLKKNEYKVIHEFAPSGIISDDLVSGFVDVKTDQPVQLGVAMVPVTDKDPASHMEDYEMLPPDIHENRGTFPKTVFYEADQPWILKDGPADMAFLPAGVPYAKGYDEVSKTDREDVGNFGIVNIIHLQTMGNEPFDLFLNPWGGAYMGTFEVWQPQTGVKIFKTEKWKDGRYFGENNGLNDVMYLGTWISGQGLTIRFISAGASNLPLHFLLVPKSRE